MKKSIPQNASVVIIGGGIAGCSVAYHLAKYGWKDVVLLERDQLTSGTTWHAAGLIGQLGASAPVTKLRKYSLDLYKELEVKTELSTGLKQNGAISIATTKSRHQELLRQASTAKLFDVKVNVLNKDEIKKLYPIINNEDIVGGVHMPLDGQADPIGVTNVLAKAARMEGVNIIEKCPVKKIIIKNKKIEGVDSQQGKIDCKYVVLASGMWSRQIASDVGVSVPLYPDEHFYIITEPIEGINKNLPTLRDFNNCLYIKEDAGKLLVGLFEPNAKAAFRNQDRIPEDFSFGEFQEDFEHFEPYLSAATKRIPSLAKVGIRKFFSGPESFTPDTNSLLGEVPEVKNFFVCCGFNSIGIVTAGGAGRITADWMSKGFVQEDLFSLDIRRFEKFHSSRKFIMERVTETLGNLYAMHWPYKQLKTSRNQKLFPYHKELKEAGACFGVVAGFERPMWYATNNKKAQYEYSFNYQNWYPAAEHETTTARKYVALFELTPFAKFDLKGDYAHQELQKICSNNIKNEPGKTTYTQMLNNNGGIESDLTVACLDKNNFRMICSSGTRTRDKHHILSNLNKNVSFKDVTEDYACLGIMGPHSRSLMMDLAGNIFSTEQFPFATGKYIEINSVKLWAQRLSYVGELGWELYIPMNQAHNIYQTIINNAPKYKLCHAGIHAMDIMRMEKKFLHWGHDMSPEENPFEAGLSFAVSFKKKENFIGKESLLKIKDKQLQKKLIMFTLQNSEPGSPLVLHDEPIYCNDKIVGRTTSGNYSFNYKKNMVFGYINLSSLNKDLSENNFSIEIEQKLYKANLQTKALHDPNNVMLKK